MASLVLRPETGKYYGRHVYYVKGKRKEKKKSFETSDLAVAKKRFLKWEAELEAAKWGETPRLQYDEASQRFFNEHCKGLSEGSVTRYKTSHKQLLRFFAGRNIAELSTRDFIAFENERRKHRGKGGHNAKVKKRTDRKVSPISIRRDFACLSAMFSFWVLKEWVTANPIPAYLKQRGKALNAKARRTRYLSHEEEARLVAELHRGTGRHHGLMLYTAVIFAIDTGLRLEEQLSLEWHQVQTAGAAHCMVYKTKSGRPRRVPLLDRASDVVSRLPVHNRARFVFWRGEGKRYLDLKKGFKAACKRAGIEDITWHDLRRTRGCRMLQDEGATMVEVRDWLGHSSIDVTERHYAFLKEEALDKFRERDRERRAELPSADIVPLRRKA